MENDAVTYNPAVWNFDFGDGLIGSLLGELLPSMTQDESATKVFPGGFHTASIQDVFLIGGELYRLRNAEGKVGQAVNSAREFIEREIRSNLLNTQTRINYQPIGKDAIIHNYGTPQAVSKDADFVGRDGEIRDVLTLEQSLVLTGKTSNEVLSIMEYLNGTNGFVWRLNEKPKNVDERVVWLDAYSGGFDLDCFRGPRDAKASFGVRFGQKNKGDHWENFFVFERGASSPPHFAHLALPLVLKFY